MRVLFVQHQPDCPPGLVGDRLDELGARLEVVNARDPMPLPASYDLIVPLGSDDSAADPSVSYLAAEWELLTDAIRGGVPVFGICFGAQLLCRVLGGTVSPLARGPEIDWLHLKTVGAFPIPPGPWLTWHLDGMTPPPDGMLASSPSAVQAFAVGPHVGVQFHPEVTLRSVESWAERYHESLARIGRDPQDVVEQTRTHLNGSRRRVAALLDQVLTRARHHVIGGPHG